MSAQARYGRLAAQGLEPLVGRVAVLLEGVPLVHHQHDPLAGLEHVPDDVRVLRGVALDRIDHHHRHVGALDRLHGAQHRVALDPAVDRSATPDAGRVDQDHRLAVDHHRRVDRVAGGAGHLGDDHPLLAQHTVDEGATCRCWAGRRSPPAAAPSRSRPARPDPPRPGRARHRPMPPARSRPAAPAAGASTSRSARSPVLRPCWALTAIGRLEAEGVELGALVLAAGVVGLVDDQDRRLAGAPQAIGHLVVERRDADGRVDHEEDQVGLLDRDARLVLHPLLDVASPARARARRCRPA